MFVDGRAVRSWRVVGPIPPETVREHVQLVLTDSSAGAGGRDHGVLATRTWRLGDLGAKHAMLRAGLGWGTMPAHMVEQDIREGRLQVIRPAELAAAGGTVMLAMCAGYRTDRPPGPAGRWMIEHLASAAMPLADPPGLDARSREERRHRT